MNEARSSIIFFRMEDAETRVAGEQLTLASILKL